MTSVSYELNIDSNASLTDIAFPRLVHVGPWGLWVVDNAALAHLDFPNLAKVDGGLEFTQNTNLAQCIVGHLVAQIRDAEGVGWGVNSWGNNDACVCQETDGGVIATCE